MKILLLGGTGAIGNHLVSVLLENGVETFVTTRKHHSSGGLLTYLQGDAHDLSFLKSVCNLQKWDAIVDFLIYTTEEFKERRELLLESTGRYVFLSTSRVYASADSPMTEESLRLLEVATDPEFLQSDDYSLAKARQEDLLHSSAQANWMIIRPYITYSESRLQMGVMEKEEWLYRAMHGRTVLFPEEMAERYTTMTYAHDVAIVIFRLILKQDLGGSTFHIASSESHKWKDVIGKYKEAFLKITGKELSVEMIGLNDFFKMRPTKYQIYYDRMYDRIFSNDKIESASGYSSYTSLEDGIHTSLKGFFEKPQFDSIYWKLEAYKDRRVREWTSLFEVPGMKNKLRYFIFRNSNF